MFKKFLQKTLTIIYKIPTNHKLFKKNSAFRRTKFIT